MVTVVIVYIWRYSVITNLHTVGIDGKYLKTTSGSAVVANLGIPFLYGHLTER